MLDSQLIAAAIKSRAVFDRIAPHFTADDFTPISKFWFQLIQQWYAGDRDAAGVDKDLLMELGRKRITNPKHEDSLLGFIRDLPEPPSADNVITVALELKRHNAGAELAQAIASHDDRKIAEMLPYYEELMQATTLVNKGRTEWQDAVAVEDLFEKVGQENRIPIAPMRLNARLNGGALPGHHIIIFGRPEEGKSLITINMAWGFVKQQLRTMYVGNEDQIDTLKSRAVARATGMSFEECEKKPKTCAKRYRDRGGEEFLLMTQLKHGTMDALERRVDEWKPDVLLVDQLRNVETDGDKMTVRLETLGRKMRDLIIDYGLIGVSVTQAGDKSERYNQEPPVWLGMGDIDNSRTGLPGTADLILGVGSNSEMKSRRERAISIPKNKLSSQPDSHEGIIVEVDQTLNKVR